MMVRAYIAEDEPLARRTLRDFMKDVDWLTHEGEAGDGASALLEIDRLKPDLLFLDIRMPELSGLEVLKRIQHQPHVVFTTAYDQYAVTAFELGAVDYLLKPFGRKRFLQTLERVKTRLIHQEPVPMDRVQDILEPKKVLEKIFARKGEVIYPIVLKDVTRLEAAENYVEIHVENQTFLVHISLGDLHARMDGDRFKRIHRSHVVNMDHIISMTPYDDRRLLVKLRHGGEILASRSGSQELRGFII